MADSHSSGDYSDVVSRRKFVSLAGTTGAAAVAGCLGDDGGDGDDGDDSDTGDSDSDSDSDDGDDDTSGGEDYPSVDTWFRTVVGSFPPENWQYNPAPAWNTPHDQNGLYAEWAAYQNTVDNWVPHLIENWEDQDGTYVLTMREDFTWASGGSVTAEDLVLQLNIQDDNGDVVWEYIDSVEASGEYELTVEYGDSNPKVVLYALLNRSANYPPSVWEDAEYDESPTEVDQPMPDASGPLSLTEQSDNSQRVEPRDGLEDATDHPLASHYNWNGYDVGHRGGNPAIHQSFIAGNIDGMHSLFVDPETLEQFPEGVRQFQIAGGFGMALWPNHDHEALGNRNVRQAFLYSIDRQAVVRNVGESTKVSHHPAPTGLRWGTIAQYLGSTEPEGFTVYNRDVPQAESLLSETDYSMGDIDLSLTFPSTWSDWATACRSVSNQLSQAGWSVTNNTQEAGPGSYAASQGDGAWLVAARQTGTGAHFNIPVVQYQYVFRNRFYDANTHFAGYTKEEVELEDGTTVNIQDTLDELLSVTEVSEMEPYIQDLGMAMNQDLPFFPIQEKYEQSFINTAKFDVPESSDHLNVLFPLWWLPKVDEKLESASESASPGLMKAVSNN